MELRLIRLGSVDSTNAHALAAAEANEARHGDLFVAEEQTAGRGRRGARWESTKGEGIYASLLLMPGHPVPHPVALTMGAGLGILGTMKALGVTEAALKWPNDVLVQGAKLCGILVESRDISAPNPTVVVGFGINVAQRRFSPALEAERPVTSLVREGVDARADDVLAVLYRLLPGRIAQALSGADETARDYLEATGLQDRRVVAERADEVVRGRLEDLVLGIGLVLRRPDGSRITLPLEHVTGLRLDSGPQG